MKRKEQIEKAATEYINSDAVSPMNMQMAFGDFINGAKWADAHPNQQMIEQMDCALKDVYSMLKICLWTMMMLGWELLIASLMA